jgi:hypothetical protein
MSARKTTTTRAFFLELVLDFVIFAICAAICLMIFAEARSESVRSAALSQLGLEAQEIAELFRSGTDDAEQIAALPDAQRDGDAVVWYYNRELLSTTGDRAYFTLTCAIDETQLVKQARITLSEGETQLLEYTVSAYLPGSPASGGDSS